MAFMRRQTLEIGKKAAQVAINGVPKRFMSSGGSKAHDIEETLKWRNITAGAAVACAGLFVYTFAGAQHHGHERPAYSYLRIRNKEFPWGPCGLFEYDCKA